MCSLSALRIFVSFGLFFEDYEGLLCCEVFFSHPVLGSAMVD